MPDVQYFFHHIQQFNKNKGCFVLHFYEQNSSPTSKNVMLMLQYLFTTVRQRQANKQARGHSTKGGCSSIEL